jgi:hypothetical protein
MHSSLGSLTISKNNLLDRLAGEKYPLLGMPQLESL